MLLAILTSCHKDPAKSYDETDMTITYYNTDFNFTIYTTFIVPDCTILTTNYLTESEIDDFYDDGGTSDKTIELLTQSFLNEGYTLVDSVAQADFIAVPTVMMNKKDEKGRNQRGPSLVGILHALGGKGDHCSPPTFLSTTSTVALYSSIRSSPPA